MHCGGLDWEKELFELAQKNSADTTNIDFFKCLILFKSHCYTLVSLRFVEQSYKNIRNYLTYLT